ncbi:MAG: hypothetical protein BRD57_05125, partial [Proteobacteria bacterium SW_6_67_9]
MLAASPAGAVAVDDLYSVRVEVVGKGEQARRDGFQEGLQRVLVRVTGRDRVLDDDGVEALLDEPAHFVQQYRYRPIDGAGEAGADGDDSDADAANDPDGNSRVQDQLAAAAQRRGLPLLLPLMDADDRQSLDFRDIKGGFFDTVRAASARYRAENLLVGYIERRDGQWSGQWHLLGIGERRTWRERAGWRSAVVDAGVAGSTERIAAAFAGGAGAIQRVRLRIRGVADLGAYAAVGDYLQGLARVQSVAVERVGPVEAVFRVNVQGQIAQLERAIRLGDTLRSVQRERDSGAGVVAGAEAGDQGAGDVS